MPSLIDIVTNFIIDTKSFDLFRSETILRFLTKFFSSRKILRNVYIPVDLFVRILSENSSI